MERVVWNLWYIDGGHIKYRQFLGSKEEAVYRIV